MNGILRNTNGHFHWRCMVRERLTYANRSICCFKRYANRIFNCNFIGSVEWTSSLSSLASLSFPPRQSPSVKIQERSSHSNRFVAVWKSEEEANLEVSPLTDFTGPHWGGKSHKGTQGNRPFQIWGSDCQLECHGGVAVLLI